MTPKQIFGLVVAIGGVLLIGFSNYIQTQVEEGRGQISRAQKQVNQSKGLFSLTPATETIGRSITGGAQKKIDAGRQEVAEYSELAGRIQLGGILLIVIGGALLVFGRKKKS